MRKKHGAELYKEKKHNARLQKNVLFRSIKL